MPPPTHDDDLIPLLDDVHGDIPGQPAGRGWQVLIVDDEKEVHQATTFALSGFKVADRLLTFLHAYSAKEGREVLAANPDVAVVLLDVVMETEDAGLKLVHEIRGALGMTATRIVLRTGQPGYAPEMKVIQEYDINDYKTKSELTRTRLATTITSAIRSYDQIRTIELSRRGLGSIANAAADLFGRHGVEQFCDAVLVHLCALVGLPSEGLVCAAAGTADELRVVGAAGRYLEFLHRPLSALGNPRVENAIRRTLDGKRNLFEADCATLCLPGHSHNEVAVFIDTPGPLQELDVQLIEVFATNISIGFENVGLFEQLHQYAYYDQLSGLPNRNKFVALIDERLAVERAGWVAGIIDIDDFSETNDALGHERGDLLIKAVAARLRAALPPEAVVVARVAGDGFGILGPASALDPERLLRLFDAPLAVDQYELHVAVSIGLVRLEDSGGTGMDAIKNANLGLKRAKGSARGGYFYYTRAIEDQTRDRVRLAHELRRCVEAQQLDLYYQPQIDLRSGYVVGVEALLRWKTQSGRFIAPDRFIPVAEKSGLIRPIGDWVLRTACRQIKNWCAAGMDDLRVAVNISIDQFRSGGFADGVMETISRYGIDPALLELEITESMAMDEVEVVMETLERLSKTGVSVAIDDFGTGFSSLGYLQQLAVDRLKIDRRFVNEIDTDGGRASIAEMIIKLGHSLGLEVVAEGVETEQQAARLAEFGCQLGQGYLYQRAVEVKVLEAWLRERGRFQSRIAVAGS